MFQAPRPAFHQSNIGEVAMTANHATIAAQSASLLDLSVQAWTNSLILAEAAGRTPNPEKQSRYLRDAMNSWAASRNLLARAHRLVRS